MKNEQEYAEDNANKEAPDRVDSFQQTVCGVRVPCLNSRVKDNCIHQTRLFIEGFRSRTLARPVQWRVSPQYEAVLHAWSQVYTIGLLKFIALQ